MTKHKALQQKSDVEQYDGPFKGWNPSSNDWQLYQYVVSDNQILIQSCVHQFETNAKRINENGVLQQKI